MREFTKVELEKELISFDKTTVMSQCVKLFETNRKLVAQRERIAKMYEAQVEVNNNYEATVRSIRSKGLITWIATWFKAKRKNTIL